MKPHVKVEITAGTIASMTDEQFAALRDNVVAEGLWETAEYLHVSGGSYLGVQPLDDVHSAMIFIGIEKDGYTHS